MISPLSDAEDRAAITGDLATNLFVEAGAGTGKTRSIVERIVNMVEQGEVDIARVAAITFTEAAARELRTRVRDALLARSVEIDSRSLLQAAGQVETAAFTTLHGFALRILSDHPVEAGLPPGFGIVDEMASIMDFDDLWNVFLGRIGDEMALYELQERAAALNVRLTSFAAIARRFDDNWDLLDHESGLPIDESPSLSSIDVEDLLDELDALAGMAELSITRDDPLYRSLVDLGAQVAILRRSAPIDQLQGLQLLDKIPSNRGRASDWRAVPGLKAVKEQARQANEHVAACAERYKAEVAEVFTRMVVNFVLRRVERRQARGELSFHDVLVLCRRLLRSNEEVRFGLHQRYTRILLDEFQDTDPIQIELAVLLAVSSPVGQRSWQSLASEVPPGRLVVVGDPKQSIYRFRRADIALYAETEDHLASVPVSLSTNFRSVPGVVAWVNDVFGAAMGNGEPGVQPAYRPLVPHRSELSADHLPVHIVGGPVEASAGQIRAMEARDIATSVCRIVQEEWPIEDGSVIRPARLSDIAVLIPSRLSLPALESAMAAAGLPFRPETNSLVYSTQEVRDVLAAIRAIVDPSNAVDVAAALRSSLFAVTDEEMVDWFEADGTWDFRLDHATVGQVAPSVKDAFTVLLEWHRRRWWTDPATMIELIVRERRLREAALAENRPRDRWRRYRFLAEQAREFSETQGGDLHDFVRWAEIQSSELARVIEPIPAEPDDDAVRLLTIHGSKGLEFPVTILAGASTVERANVSGPQVAFSERGPEVKLGKGTETTGYSIQASIEDMMDGFERVRLHYVAATRARDYLIASAYHKVVKSGRSTSMGRRTWEACERMDAEAPGRWQLIETIDPPRYLTQAPTQLRFGSGAYPEQAARWQREQDVILDELNRSRQLSPTALSQIHRGVRPLSVEIVGDGATTLVAGREVSGAGLGSAVHDVLEHVDFDDPSTVDALTRAAARANGVEEATDEIARRVKRALATETMAEASLLPHWRELYVSIPSFDGGVEGFIDLCFETDEGLVIVDYKTDAVDQADLEQSLMSKLAEYRIQLATYAVALEQVVDKPVVDCRLLFITDKDTYARSLSDLDQAKRDVTELLAAQLA